MIQISGSALAEWLKPYQFFCVGSLPFVSTPGALKFSLETPGLIPFWPELPRKGERELSLSRAARALSPDWNGYEADEASGFFELLRLRQNLPKLKIIKSQLLGPLSLAYFCESMSGDLASRLDSALQATMRQIDWQRELLRSVAERVLFVLDEPGLGMLQDIEAETISKLSDMYSYLYISATDPGDYLGLHTCASFAPSLLDLPIDLLSFDACIAEPLTQLFMPYKAKWSGAISRGMVIAPGVWRARQEAPFEPAIVEGRRRAVEIASYLNSVSSNGKVVKCLYSANCGHAFAEEEWLRNLYSIGA